MSISCVYFFYTMIRNERKRILFYFTSCRIYIFKYVSFNYNHIYVYYNIELFFMKYVDTFETYSREKNDNHHLTSFIKSIKSNDKVIIMDVWTISYKILCGFHNFFIIIYFY